MRDEGSRLGINESTDVSNNRTGRAIGKTIGHIMDWILDGSIFILYLFSFSRDMYNKVPRKVFSPRENSRDLLRPR